MLRRDLLKGFGSLLGLSTLKSKEEDYYEQYFKTSYPNNNDDIKPLVQCSGSIKNIYDLNISCSGSWGV